MKKLTILMSLMLILSACSIKSNSIIESEPIIEEMNELVTSEVLTYEISYQNVQVGIYVDELENIYQLNIEKDGIKQTFIIAKNTMYYSLGENLFLELLKIKDQEYQFLEKINDFLSYDFLNKEHVHLEQENNKYIFTQFSPRYLYLYQQLYDLVEYFANVSLPRLIDPESYSLQIIFDEENITHIIMTKGALIKFSITKPSEKTITSNRTLINE